MTTEKTESPLKIIRLDAENIKRLTAVSIKPDGTLVHITGKNGAGKSSVLDSIMWAIDGAAGIQAEPIRKGQKNAEIRVDMGDVIVTRKFRKRDDGSTTSDVFVENADGARHTSPQQTLNKWLGKITLDPMQFDRMKPKEKFDALRVMVPGYDFDKMAALDLGDRAKRTDIARKAKEAATLAGAIAIPETALERQDENALTDELEQVASHNAAIENRKARRAEAANGAAAIRGRAKIKRDQVEVLRKEIEALEYDAITLDGQAKTLDDQLANAEALPEPKDAAEVRTRLDKAKRNNQLVALEETRKKHLETAATLEKEAEALTTRITEREAAKQAAIAAAKLPVEGLEFGDGELMMNGSPFEQASSAERLRTSVAVAMAGNPRIRVLRITDGSLLDEDGLKIIATMAQEKGWQCWIESVDSGGKTGIVIEDGHVASTPESRGDQPDLLENAAKE